MGFWDFLTNRVSNTVYTPRITHLGAGMEEYAAALGVDARSLAPSQMWSTQPHLRTVVSFMARNVAQLGLHTFERVSETDRKRDRTSPFAATMRRPNLDMTAFDLIFSLVGDKALYDTAYWHVAPDPDAASGWTIRRIPPAWVTPVARDVFGNKEYVVQAPNGAKEARIPASEMLCFSGYNPTSPRSGSPTIDALRETLQEQIEASKFRNQVWKRGGRVSSVLQRPKDAPQWSDGAREQFREDWYAKYTGNGPKAGGTPILEDGMTLQRIDFSAADQQFVEGAKLSFSTVASAFHINPTMIGILDNANYANVREFRRMLYGDSLGPLTAEIEDRVNTFLLPMMGMDSGTYYAEFNIGEKLQGSFEEQATVMQTMVGGPVMTRNEGRARFNLPAITDGGADELIVPLNVLVGGQASPTDAGTQNVRSGRAGIKAAVERPAPDEATALLRKFFSRQRSVVLSRLKSKDGASWWDEERWNRELAEDLNLLALSVTSQIGTKTAEQLGFRADAYRVDQTANFLTEVAKSRASLINNATLKQIQDLADGDDPAAVFDHAESVRAEVAGATLMTTFAAFASVEAAKQTGGETATKTWTVNSRNPRSSHAALNGETVPVDDAFSNGMNWPGDPAGGADEVSDCQCSVEVNVN